MSRRVHLDHLRSASPVVLPSLLLCDFGNLEREVRRLEAAGVRGLHLDVMDGHFVPNLTYGMPVVAALRRLTELPLDVHLMISNPEQYARQFFDAGADIITFHVEATREPAALLDQIRYWGAGAGIALNPKTPLSMLAGCLELCDLVLVMSVEAGFGGQKFNPLALEKLSEVRRQSRRDVLIEVDGGINPQTIGPCAQAGADLFVAGSAIFHQPDYLASVAALTEAAQKHREHED